jgi:transmembrane sensor
MEPVTDAYNNLVIKYISGEATDEEKQQLLFWIDANKENEDNFFSFKELYELGRWNNLQKEAQTNKEWEKLYATIQNQKVHSKNRIVFNVIKYAAVLLIGIISTYWLLNQNNRNKIQQFDLHQITKIETGKGERTKITLPDGTKVWINACSSLSYNKNYGGQFRIAHLKGEAYFEVAKNATKPFIVNAMGYNIKAHGTSFDVSAYKEDNNVSAILVEGSISFRNDKSNNQQYIKPGQKIMYSKLRNKIEVSNVDTVTYTTWRIGEYRFDNLTFGEIAKRLERIYNVNFVFLSGNTKKIPFTGTFFSYEPLDQVLNVIKVNTSMKFWREKSTIYIK